MYRHCTDTLNIILTPPLYLQYTRNLNTVPDRKVVAQHTNTLTHTVHDRKVVA